MSEMRNNRADLIESFKVFRKDSNWWNYSYETNLQHFDHFCCLTFPDSEQLTQEMVDLWAAPRSNEAIESCRSRLQVVITFIKYLRERSLTDIVPPALPARQPHKYIPHAFSSVELSRFFTACDQAVLDAAPGKDAMDALTTSVFFRLLYSSGIRTFEARLLKTDDSDLDNGVLNIRTSKGNRQYYVALDDDVCIMLRNYNNIASVHFPDRTYFFTVHDKVTIDAKNLRRRFFMIWNKVNTSHAVPYDFRHNYAISNINTWLDSGFQFHDKMLYLSKSMGHTRIESTQYYYALTPYMATIVYDCSNDSFNDIVPEVKQYEG